MKNIIQDINLLYNKDDKFLGEFAYDKHIVLERKYLDHTNTRRIYFTKIYNRHRNAKAQIVIVHGFTSSSNFVEV